MLILRNSKLQKSELQNNELRSSELWNSELRHTVDYCTVKIAVAELITSSSGL
jgi:hypothetical protein